MRRLPSVPDQNAAVVGRAREDAVVDGADGQAVHSVYMQEHVQSFLTAGATVGHRLIKISSVTHQSAVLKRQKLLQKHTVVDFVVPTSPRREESPVRRFLGDEKAHK